MVSNFDSLPSEVQCMVFQNLKNYKLDIRECILVCKKWKDRHQSALYSHVSLSCFLQLLEFLNTLENNQYLSSLVINLKFDFDSGYENRKKYSTIIKLFSLLTNLEHIDCSQGTFFRLLLDALLTNYLPKLNHIVPPQLFYEIETYASCAIIIRDRLQNLDFSERLEGDWEESDDEDVLVVDAAVDDSFNIPSERNRVQFYRLYDRLNQFKNLKELRISKKAVDPIEFMEDVTHACQPSVRHLEIKIDNGNNSSMIENIDLAKLNISPMPNITHLNFGSSVTKNSQLIVYLTKKFPCLKRLRFFVGMEETTLDEPAYNQFLNYVSNIKCVDLSFVPCTEKSLLRSVGPFWKKITQSCTLSVEFTYDDIYSFPNMMDLNIKDGIIKNKIYFPPSGRKSQHADAIKKYGRYIDCLTVSSLTSTLEAIFLHPIQHFTNLKQLTIVQSSINVSSPLDDDFLEKRRLDSLRFIDCSMYKELVCSKITNLLDYINYFEIALKPVSKRKRKSAVIDDIRMTGTDIGTLSLSRTDLSSDREYPPLLWLVRITTLQGLSYYLYDFHKMNDHLPKPIEEEEYHKFSNGRRCLLVNINCKSLKNLRVSH